MARALKQKEVERKMQALSGWKVSPKHTQISKSYTFQNFVSALAFVAKIAVHAEVMEHHPTLTLSYDKVEVKLTTHDAKGLTKKDFELAERIDGLKV